MPRFAGILLSARSTRSMLWREIRGEILRRCGAFVLRSPHAFGVQAPAQWGNERGPGNCPESTCRCWARGRGDEPGLHRDGLAAALRETPCRVCLHLHSACVDGGGGVPDPVDVGQALSAPSVNSCLSQCPCVLECGHGIGLGSNLCGADIQVTKDQYVSLQVSGP